MLKTTFPSSQSKPPFKRRKLLRSGTPSPTSSVVGLKNVVVAAATATSATTVNSGPNKGAMGSLIPICTSCHRASPTGGTNMIQCAVCASTTCTVCSRRCTHSAASQPPTPHLTWSPSPSPSISACASPLRRSRSVLSLVNLSNTNLPDVLMTPTQQSISTGKRRKAFDEDDEDGRRDVMPYAGPPKDRLLLAPGEFAAEERHAYLYQDEYGPGCARLVCRKCCYEDVASNTTTCLECYGSPIS
ncbi:hypothetical protein GALMADRAFT_785114 [Galerina marginata CBS 339.88]|uniref:Uncharacterized protein n=1 Tax=Galerina marginata (strain CBS 339.88) TaxID=685588 RepID=A0A067SLW3_GALM3|nr:hypothetical protein GALMADRAFT_785114 [Galerina marginata CBS 339.88]